MMDLSIAEFKNNLAMLLTEAYAGPPDPSSTWFIDNEPDAGILGLIAHVSAAQASRPVNGPADPGSTIAAHIEHLRWSLAQTNASLRGEEPPWKWKESWHLIEADPAEWDRLRTDLQTEFEMLLQELPRLPELSGELLSGILALLPHAAYHLGTIRQMIERVR
jgi:hypothetical protein